MFFMRKIRKRMNELLAIRSEEEKETDLSPVSIRSYNAAIQFFKTLGGTKTMPYIFLTTDGNYRAEWENKNGFVAIKFKSIGELTTIINGNFEKCQIL
jgi:hypothetical protein